MRYFAYSIIFLVFVVKDITSISNAESWTGKWFPEEPKKAKTVNKDLEDLFNPSQSKPSNKPLTSDKNNTETWKGNWFPENPIGAENTGGKDKNTTKTWNGNWFPQKPSDTFINKTTTGDSSHEKTAEYKKNDTWKGDWFPQSPYDMSNNSSLERLAKKPWDGNWFPTSPSSELLDLNLMPSSNQCDNGKDNIGIDFDPENKRHAYKYLCLDFKAKYEPSFSIQPIQRKVNIPPAYEAPSYCLNETIKYEERLPTYGAHRYVSPKYGEYKYIPVQRWMHSLEKGAIVMLYHPCANQMQVEKLRNAVRACLYRHVISPSTLLLPDRPLALVAWGTSLEMSVVHLPAVVEFIKENARHGAQAMYDDNNSYQSGFLTEAKLVTDESDAVLCPDFNL